MIGDDDNCEEDTAIPEPTSDAAMKKDTLKDGAMGSGSIILLEIRIEDKPAKGNNDKQLQHPVLRYSVELDEISRGLVKAFDNAVNCTQNVPQVMVHGRFGLLYILVRVCVCVCLCIKAWYSW